LFSQFLTSFGLNLKSQISNIQVSSAAASFDFLTISHNPAAEAFAFALVGVLATVTPLTSPSPPSKGELG
jgi:hypothetical protein